MPTKEKSKKRNQQETPPKCRPLPFFEDLCDEKTEKACARTAVVHLLRDLNAEQKQKRQLVTLMSPESW